MKLLEVKKSTRPAKKWMAIFCKCNGDTKCKPGERKTVHFGATGYSDYTIHKDKERRRLYRLRHDKEKNQNVDTPGFLAYFLLWGESTDLQENVRKLKYKFHC